jgi:hypothetical protein
MGCTRPVVLKNLALERRAINSRNLICYVPDRKAVYIAFRPFYCADIRTFIANTPSRQTTRSNPH